MASGNSREITTSQVGVHDKLDDLVRPYVHKILVVIEPLLIDEVKQRKCVRLYTICHTLNQLK